MDLPSGIKLVNRREPGAAEREILTVRCPECGQSQAPQTVADDPEPRRKGGQRMTYASYLCVNCAHSWNDVFPVGTFAIAWPDEDRIRSAMTEAQEHPGRVVTR